VYEFFYDDEPICLSDKGKPVALVCKFFLVAPSLVLGIFSDILNISMVFTFIANSSALSVSRLYPPVTPRGLLVLVLCTCFLLLEDRQPLFLHFFWISAANPWNIR
jgi:hypothetical protein